MFVTLGVLFLVYGSLGFVATEDENVVHFVIKCTILPLLWHFRFLHPLYVVKYLYNIRRDAPSKTAKHDGVDRGLGACHKFEEFNQKQNLVFNW